MRLSKKGAESFPFFLFLTLLVAAFVIVIGFYQINSFSKFSAKKDLTDTYNDLTNAMETLRSTTDQGSFTRVVLKIPAKHNMTISADNTIRIIGPNLDLNNTPGFNIIGITDKQSEVHDEYTFEKGAYEIVVYYGNVSLQKEPLEIFFV